MSKDESQEKVEAPKFKGVENLRDLAEMFRDYGTLYEQVVAAAAEIEHLQSCHNRGRWNIDEVDGELRICRGNHERGDDCSWEIYLPEKAVSAPDIKHTIAATVNQLINPPPFRDVNNLCGRLAVDGNIYEAALVGNLWKSYFGLLRELRTLQDQT